MNMDASVIMGLAYEPSRKDRRFGVIVAIDVFSVNNAALTFVVNIDTFPNDKDYWNGFRVRARMALDALKESHFSDVRIIYAFNDYDLAVRFASNVAEMDVSHIFFNAMKDNDDALTPQ